MCNCTRIGWLQHAVQDNCMYKGWAAGKQFRHYDALTFQEQGTGIAPSKDLGLLPHSILHHVPVTEFDHRWSCSTIDMQLDAHHLSLGQAQPCSTHLQPDIARLASLAPVRLPLFCVLRHGWASKIQMGLLLPLLFAAFARPIHASHQPVALNDLCLEPGLELPRLPIIAEGRLTGAASLVHYKRDPTHTGPCSGAHRPPVLPTEQAHSCFRCSQCADQWCAAR